MLQVILTNEVTKLTFGEMSSPKSFFKKVESLDYVKDKDLANEKMFAHVLKHFFFLMFSVSAASATEAI